MSASCAIVFFIVLFLSFISLLFTITLYAHSPDLSTPKLKIILFLYRYNCVKFLTSEPHITEESLVKFLTSDSHNCLKWGYFRATPPHQKKTHPSNVCSHFFWKGGIPQAVRFSNKYSMGGSMKRKSFSDQAVRIKKRTGVRAGVSGVWQIEETPGSVACLKISTK